MTRQIDGKKHADIILQKNRKRASKLIKGGTRPGLATVIVGQNPASKLYVSIKQKACERVGIYTEHYCLPSKVSQKQLIGLIKKLNEADKIHGILIQLPLPKKFNTNKILSCILPGKDVDGLSPLNLGKLQGGDELLAPATPKGIIHLLEKNTPLEGAHVVVVNHSIVVGKPLAIMLLNRDATVTVCHVKTKNLGKHTQCADVLVTATGVPHIIKKGMLKKNAIVIDAGIGQLHGKFVGDVDPRAAKYVKAITPVPGGVGPMTVAMVIENTLNASSL